MMMLDETRPAFGGAKKGGFRASTNIWPLTGPELIANYLFIENNDLNIFPPCQPYQPS